MQYKKNLYQNVAWKFNIADIPQTIYLAILKGLNKNPSFNGIL